MIDQFVDFFAKGRLEGSKVVSDVFLWSVDSDLAHLGRQFWVYVRAVHVEWQH
jgi:hypothetical protein